MKRIFTKTAILYLFLLANMACKKEKVKFYDGPSGVYFKNLNSDLFSPTRPDEKATSIIYYPLYNFAFEESNRLRDTLAKAVAIIGRASDKDRVVDIQVVADSTTAVKDRDYEILPCVIKAGKFEDSARVIVKRSAAMKTNELKLMIKIVPNIDFPETIHRNAKVSFTQLSFVFKDKAGKPANWDGIYYDNTYYPGYGLGEVFGDYSETKFRLIVKQFGTANLLGIYEGSQIPLKIWKANIIRLMQQLADYKQKNGSPMLDENGNEVVIPPITNAYLLYV